MCVITRQRPRPRASFRLPSAPATVIASIKAEAAVMGYAHDVDSPRAHSCALVMIHALAIFYGRAKHSSKDEGGPSLQQSRKLKRLDTVASCCGRSALRHPGFAATVALVGFTYGPHIMVSSRSSHSGGTQRRLVSKKAPLGGLPYVLPQPRLQKSASGVRSQTAPLISNDTHKQKQVSQLHSQYQNIGSPPAHVSMPRCVQKIKPSPPQSFAMLGTLNALFCAGENAVMLLHVAIVVKSKGASKYSRKVYEDRPGVGGDWDWPSARQLVGRPSGESTKKILPTDIVLLSVGSNMVTSHIAPDAFCMVMLSRKSYGAPAGRRRRRRGRAFAVLMFSGMHAETKRRTADNAYAADAEPRQSECSVGAGWFQHSHRI